MFTTLLVLFTSPWLFRAWLEKPVLAILIILSSLTLYQAIIKGEIKKILTFGVCLVLLLFAQYMTTKIEPLNYLDNDEQRIQAMRLREYPPIFIKFGDKTLWIPLAHWFEERKETISLTKIQKNLGEFLDINLYFYGNYPRGRVNIKEIEKLPYIYLPPFLTGAVALIRQKKSLKISLFAFLLPLLLTSLFGHDNPLGPFSVFPFIATITAFGISLIKNKKVSILYLIAAFFVIIQTFSYV